MTTIVKVNNLGKKYILKHQAKAQYKSIREVWTNKFKNIGRMQNQNSEPKEEFWALKDINFEIQQGDKVGIIGRNGAGKSTLLKILSRITEPTTGSIKINGRVASLLEVGTGFHPELTGRENVYLNGAILGMRQSEIKQKFDEIVNFADVEKFIDTPVKRYSSGMYMRLAFAVAAHLEPDILIVDEVLAVGDAQFQKKCLGKMNEVSRDGRTVIFVSHSMPTITSLCSKCILLDQGSLVKEGDVSDVVMHYYTNGGLSPSFVDFSKLGRVVGDEYVTLLSGMIKDKNNHLVNEIDIRNPVKVCMRFRVNSESRIRYIPNFHFLTATGVYAFVSGHEPILLSKGEYEVECNIPSDFLNEGAYFIGLAISSYEPGLTIHYFEENAITFNVKDPMEGSIGRNAGYANVMPGVVRPKLDWSYQKI